ncbi:DMT family transporter [Nitrososphaera viennensis]|uniref:DMT family transporter n=1 Tax=Nitrososphaera viennensis TaxID=1034015 RepID=A0A977NM65_9ARCH|nr:DMT family transporter [Nitrososphaera viennensis]UVS69498.1 DMT family transporter [Nitrososphaera viennensis]
MTAPEQAAPAGAQREQKGYLGYLSVLIASALFGSVFAIAKVPLANIDPLALSAVIYMIAGLTLVPFAKASFRLQRREARYMVAITAFGAVAAPVLLLHGLQLTEASDASILANGEVLFTVILSSLFFGERPHGRLGIVAVSLVIVGLFMATTDMKFSGTMIAFNAGNLMILASMFFWAIDNNFSRKLTTFSDISPAKMAMIKSLAGGLVLLGVTAVAGKWGAFGGISAQLWLIIIALSASGFGAALLFFLAGIKRIGTIKTMTVFSTTPIFGIVIAAAALGESISIFQAIATGLIITGILIVSRR